MAKTTKILQSLNAGELSPQLDFRIDQQKYQMGCRTLENFIPLIYGGVERRPGTYYSGGAKDHSAKVRLVDFVYSVDQAYILEFGNQYIRVYANNGRFVGLTLGNNASWATGVTYYAGDFVEAGSKIYRCLISHVSDSGGGDGTGGTPNADANATQWENATDGTGTLTSDNYPIYEVPSPYLTADLFGLKFEQSADVMYITHPDYEPRKLSRISTTTFVLQELNYGDGPFQDVNTVTTALITASAKTGTVTLTASGTNADGTAFQPFKTGTTAGHGPSGASGATTSIGTSQTNKSITGALFQIIHATDADTVKRTITGGGQTTSNLVVRKGVQWDAVTNGTWSGTLVLEREYPDNAGVWETVHTVVSSNNNNVQVDGTEEVDDANYRWRADSFTSGSALVQLSVRDSSVLGVVEITSVASATSATGTVRETLGSTDATHRWAEGHWSNYRGWPNSVAISSEERLTFAGSRSFPLTVWGSVSGDYTSMKAGTLDDDAVVFTLVGSGRQNEIRWIVSKNNLILGTYGGEHVLGASSEDEAMTPSNVRARIQSTYGSDDIQAIVVGDAVLYVQRGGRKLREMHYDFARDSQISDDLTVFANHITESSINDVAYQRTPDPMVWCVRDDGELAVLSYERSQEVFSWCRVKTKTHDASDDVDTDSIIESVAVIPGSEEDQVWISVKRYIPDHADAVSGWVRFVEYFSTRDF